MRPGIERREVGKSRLDQLERISGKEIERKLVTEEGAISYDTFLRNLPIYLLYYLLYTSFFPNEVCRLVKLFPFFLSMASFSRHGERLAHPVSGFPRNFNRCYCKCRNFLLLQIVLSRL